MAFLLGMILFSLNGVISTTFQEYFVNITEPKCLALLSDKDTIWDGKSISLKRRDKALYIFNDNEIRIDQSLQNVSINRTTKEVKFCIPYTTSNDSGNYSLSIDNTIVVASATLYVMVKPFAPQVYILSNGTLNTINGTLECKAESASLPSGVNFTYSWLVNRETVQEGDKYTFENSFHSKLSVHVSRYENQNLYSCTATEEHGQTSEVSSGKSIDPLRSPLSTISPTYPVLKEIKDNPLKLVCSGSDGNPSYYNFAWFQNGVELNGEKSETLFIQHIDHINGGNYTCSVNNSIGNDVSTTVLLDVLYGPIVSTINSISQEEGKGVTVHCNVSSNPSIDVNQVMWRRPNNSTFFQQGKDLKILKVQKDDDGIFLCTANLTLVPTVGDEKRKMAFANVTLNVLYGPTISLISEYDQIEGRTINISCDVISNPPIENKHIKWTKRGSNYQLSGRNLIENNVNRSFTGTYECTAFVKLNVTVGAPVDKHASKLVSVSVLYQPIIVNVTPVMVFEGNSTQIKCVVDANPTPNVTWTYMENATNVKETIFHTNSLISTSVIEFISPRCEDTGTYGCYANNNISSPTTEVVPVNVQCSPRLSYLKSSSITIGRNESLNLTVMFHAVPAPSFNWEFNKSDLTNFVVIPVNDSLPYKFGSRLEKEDFGESNIGQYTISASNALGTASAILNIKYQREPFIPDIDDLICGKIPRTATLDWSSLGNGGLEQHFVIVYRQWGQIKFSESDIIKEKEGNKYTKTIYHLIENAKYVFKIKAGNDLGSKSSIEVNCTVSGQVEQVPVLPIIGAVIGSAIGIAVLMSLFFNRRRYKSKKPRNDKALIQRNAANDQDNDEGLKDNPLYVQSDTVREYSPKRNKHQGNMIKEIKEADVHENSEDFTGIEEGVVYGNVDGNTLPLKNLPFKTKKNKDGLVYADLEFNPSSSGFVIRGLEKKSIYADIDLTQKADPLPFGSDDDEPNGSHDKQVSS